MIGLSCGAWILLGQKGTARHVRLRWVYLASMLWVDGSALSIRRSIQPLSRPGDSQFGNGRRRCGPGRIPAFHTPLALEALSIHELVLCGAFGGHRERGLRAEHGCILTKAPGSVTPEPRQAPLGRHPGTSSRCAAPRRGPRSCRRTSSAGSGRPGRRIGRSRRCFASLGDCAVASSTR